MRLFYSFIASLLLHLAVLLFMLQPSYKPVQPKTPEAKKNYPALQVTIVAEGEAVHKSGTSERTAFKRSCNGQFYTGIGLLTNIADSVVSIAKGGPADQAGFKLDDILIERQALEPDLHAEGVKLTVPVMRKGHRLDIPVTVGKICST